jgi:hypothetical protein
MDFYSILTTKLKDASPEERFEFYQEMRTNLVQVLKRNGQEEGSKVYQGYIEKFETATRDFEKQQTLITTSQVNVMDKPNDVAIAAATVQQVAQSGNEAAPASKGRALMLIALGIAVGVAGYALVQKLTRSQGAALVESFDQRLPTFNANLTHLQRLRSALETQRSQTGNFPRTADSFVPLSSVVGTIPAFSGLMSHPYEEGSTLLYRSDGKDYKLLVYRSGDCFMARSLEPKMIDPVRATGPVDCIYHGYWTSGAAEW